MTCIEDRRRGTSTKIDGVEIRIGIAHGVKRSVSTKRHHRLFANSQRGDWRRKICFKVNRKERRFGNRIGDARDGVNREILQLHPARACLLPRVLSLFDNAVRTRIDTVECVFTVTVGYLAVHDFSVDVEQVDCPVFEALFAGVADSVFVQVVVFDATDRSGFRRFDNDRSGVARSHRESTGHGGTAIVGQNMGKTNQRRSAVNLILAVSTTNEIVIRSAFDILFFGGRRIENLMRDNRVVTPST